MKILIVEDVFIEAFDLQLMLADKGYEITGIAHTAEEAFRLVAARRPDLVCLDIFLRGSETGIDIAAQLQQQEIGFVFISANTYTHIDEHVRNMNPLGYVSKPFRELDVLPVIEAAAAVLRKGIADNQFIRHDR